MRQSKSEARSQTKQTASGGTTLKLRALLCRHWTTRSLLFPLEILAEQYGFALVAR